MTTKEQLDGEREEILGHLGALLAQRREAEAIVREIREKQDRLVVKAMDAGVPKLVVSRTAGLTRQTIYAILLRDENAKAKAAS
jgi:hypothetical protein